MKKLNYLILFLCIIGCSNQPMNYDSFSHRQSEFDKTELTISENGLTPEMVKNILATKFPPNKKVSISLIILNNNNYNRYGDNNFSYYIMEESKNINEVEKFAPIPRILIPNRLTFDAIQQLGIRNLSEYTLLIYSNSNNLMTFKQFLHGQFKFESDVEFTLIDNQTTAIIASDRLYSFVIKNKTIIATEDIEEAENELFSMQAKKIVEKLNLLFKRN